MAVFEILGEIRNVENIAVGRGIFIRRYLDRVYGKGRWRKMKGTATVRLADGTVAEAEIHWFEHTALVAGISRSRGPSDERFCNLH